MIPEFLSNLNIRVPEDLRRRLEHMAVRHKKSLSQVCRELLSRATQKECESN